MSSVTKIHSLVNNFFEDDLKKSDKEIYDSIFQEHETTAIELKAENMFQSIKTQVQFD